MGSVNGDPTNTRLAAGQHDSWLGSLLVGDLYSTIMMADEDPLLISQSLTYVTDDGGILHSFRSASMSLST